MKAGQGGHDGTVLGTLRKRMRKRRMFRRSKMTRRKRRTMRRRRRRRALRRRRRSSASKVRQTDRQINGQECLVSQSRSHQTSPPMIPKIWLQYLIIPYWSAVGTKDLKWGPGPRAENGTQRGSCTPSLPDSQIPLHNTLLPPSTPTHPPSPKPISYSSRLGH